MAVMTKYDPGIPSWVDLGTPDPAEASRFYSDLFGWTIEEGPPEFGGYRMCLLDGQARRWARTADERRHATVSGRRTSASPAPTRSLQPSPRTAAAIIVAPMDVIDVGRMAVAADPAGAVFSIWQPGTHPGAGIVNEPNTWSWSELNTRDPQRSVEFYGAVFGWEAHLVPGARVINATPANYTEFHLADRRIAGMLPMVGDSWPADMPTQWVVYFAVEDCEAAVAKVEALGGTVMMPPTVIPPWDVRGGQGSTRCGVQRHRLAPARGVIESIATIRPGLVNTWLNTVMPCADVSEQ